MPTPEPHKPGFKPILLVMLLLLGIGLTVGLVKLFGYATKKITDPQSQLMAVGLATGIHNFHIDYKRWPVDDGERHQSDATLLANLLGRDMRLNKRGRNYLDILPIAKSPERRVGLLQTGDRAELFDSWGNYFVITLDHDNDGWVDNPEGPSSHGPAKLNLKVAVVSPGPDGVLSGKNRDGKDATLDNFRSW